MKFWEFVRDRVEVILVWGVAMVLVGLILVAFKVPGEAILAVMGIFLVGGTVSLGVEFGRKRRFYRELLEKVEQLDQAYLVLETMREPEFYEGKLIWRAMKEINKSMTENVQRERERSRDFQEYIEMWIHEVKRPLASLGLVVENLWKTPEKTGVDQENGKMGKLAKKGEKEKKNEQKIRRNLRELEKYVEQVLYFVRSENAEKDYLIREVDLDEVVRKVGMRNMDDFLDYGVEFEVEMGKEEELGEVDGREARGGRGKNVAMKVYSDAKWLEFVVNQIVDNSIKYRREKGAKVVIRGWKENGVLDGDENRTENEKNRTILEIEDNGIGINARDLPMVFEKTFTGTNGRKLGVDVGLDRKGVKVGASGERGVTSTGMGLYIAKNLCEKLGHKIEIESKEGKGTKVRIIFEDNGFYGVVK